MKKALKRWQEWVPLMIGVLLVLTPFVFGIETVGSRSWDAWVLGAIVGVVSMALATFWLTLTRNRVIEVMTVMVGTVLFITPWVLGVPWLSAGTWVSCLVGIVLAIAAGRVLVENRGYQAEFRVYRTLYNTPHNARLN